MEIKRRVIDKRNKEKFLVDDAYLNGYAKLCGIHATGVYMVLCRHADKQQECFPSKKTIAEKLDISERSVYSAIQELEKRRIIHIEGRGRSKTGKFRSYDYILRDKSEWIMPQAKYADGTQGSQPSARHAVSHRHVVPSKDTHIKDTHIKELPKGREIQTYGNEDINYLIVLLKENNHGLIDGSERDNRRYCWLLLQKLNYKKDGEKARNGAEVIIKTALQSNFHSKNATSFKYLYNHASGIIADYKNKNKGRGLNIINI
mgnify:CR=1 FL=1